MKKQLDFIGIGTPKCGTEWLAECIRKHPEVDFSKHKEPNFYLSKDSGLYSFVYDHMRIKEYKDYLEEFTWEKGKKHGEFSIQYIFDKKALKKIKKDHPNIKIIVSLRNPIDFLYSMFWYLKFSNIYHLVPNTFEHAIKTKDTEFLFHTKYAYFGRYMSTVLSVFKKKNVHVVFLSEIKARPKTVLKKIYKFLEIDENFKPGAANKHLNKTRQVRSPWFMRIVNLSMKIIALLKLSKFLNYSMNTSNIFKRVYRMVAHTNKGYPPMKKSTRKMLIKKYSADIKTLEKHVGKNLSRFYS